MLETKVKTSGFLTKLVIVFVIIILIASAFKVQLTLNDLKNKKTKLENELKTTEYQVEKLQNEYDKAIDDEYIAEIAKKRLKYREPGEIIFYNDLSD